MAHKQLPDGRVVVDWTTGDPEGDRIHLLQAYSDFIKEVKEAFENEHEGEAGYLISRIFDKWKVSTDNQVDEFPRIWIERPK